MQIALPSFAKINWRLDVLGRREDGYHEVRTYLQTITLHDTLSFEEIDDGIELICDRPDLPVDGRNLVVRATERFRTAAGIRRGVRIHLEKSIPVAAGLGGGSSNAAVTLLGLDRLWGTDVAAEKMRELASSLGSDVPFFLTGGTAIGSGRGEEIEAAVEQSEARILLINPGIAISAAEAYGALPRRLTLPYVKDKMPFSFDDGFEGQFPLKLSSMMRNHLEPGVVELYPELGEIRKRMERLGAVGTLMSGSGATFFALFETDAALAAAMKDIEDTGWWCKPVATVSRQQYRKALGLTQDVKG